METPRLDPSPRVIGAQARAYLLTQTFCYHSTFDREQWKLKAAHGIELTRNLMCSWHDHLANLLRPLHSLLASAMRSASYIKVDETQVRCLEPGKGKTVLGYFRLSAWHFI